MGKKKVGPDRENKIHKKYIRSLTNEALLIELCSLLKVIGNPEIENTIRLSYTTYFLNNLIRAPRKYQKNLIEILKLNSVNMPKRIRNRISDLYKKIKD